MGVAIETPGGAMPKGSLSQFDLPLKKSNLNAQTMKSITLGWDLRLGFRMAVFLLATLVAHGSEKWTIHEWGTFTSLQNEKGEAIGGINTDDEPVPKFVHRLAQFILLRPTELPRTFFQGAPSCHPDVTMRLETPVIYFHPPKSEANNPTVNVHVTFRGGWLTEFYPDALPDAAGLREQGFGAEFPHLRSNTEGRLAWNNLKIGGNWPVTNTFEHVWTAPRAVQTATVQTASGESEKFLFYRGVGHLNAPLKISQDLSSGELLIRSQLEHLPAEKPLIIPSLWLVDIQRNGQLAFRTLPPLALSTNSNKILTHTSATFKANDFSMDNLADLKKALKSSLMAEGLFGDEAEALLNTWELSYFKSTGLRVFFIVPRAWSDFYLPLEISQPADINRVMVGRIELITPGQREALRQISAFPAQTIHDDAVKMRKSLYESGGIGTDWASLSTGKRQLAASVNVPKSYQTYLDLGRFRNALVLDEQKSHPSEGLRALIATYALDAYKPTDVAFESDKQ